MAVSIRTSGFTSRPTPRFSPATTRCSCRSRISSPSQTVSSRTKARSAIEVASGEAVDALAPYLQRLALIALAFPKFSDGRAYSSARLLRERLGFTGELRAIGDVLADQIPLMRRCGITSFAVSHAPTRARCRPAALLRCITTISRSRPRPAKHRPARGRGLGRKRAKAKPDFCFSNPCYYFVVTGDYRCVPLFEKWEIRRE